VLRHLSRWGWLPSSRRQLARVIIAVVVIFAAGALTIVLSGGFMNTSSGARTGHASGGSAGSAARGSSAVLAAAADDRQRAASWIAAQVDRSAIVACDQVMCSALAAGGFPAANLMTLTPASTDPLGSEIVVSTEAVRSQFGSKLADVYAPAVLASFGAGAAGVEVRVMAPDGAAAYQHALSADLSDRRAAGEQLLRNARLQVSGQARSDLATGQVDSRLLATLVNLTGQYQVRVLAFGDAGPGASPGIPLRYAEIAVGAAAGRHGGTPSLAAILTVVRAQIPPFLPASIQAHTAAGKAVLGIEFAAPSPPGLVSQLAAR
jgi:hypothetical protein